MIETFWFLALQPTIAAEMISCMSCQRSRTKLMQFESPSLTVHHIILQILKEEVHDLLDPNLPTEIVNGGGHAGGINGLPFGGGSKMMTHVGTVKQPIQIRETSNGGITLAGVTESDVNSLDEMATCLEQGSLCRATGSTNMNSSSRSVMLNPPLWGSWC